MIDLIKFTKNQIGFMNIYGQTFLRLVLFVLISSIFLLAFGLVAILAIIPLTAIVIKLGDDYVDEIILKSVRKNRSFNFKLLENKAIYEIFTYTYGLDDYTNEEIMSLWNQILSMLNVPITLIVYKSKLNLEDFKVNNANYNKLFDEMETIVEHYFLVVNENDAAQLESILDTVSLSYYRLDQNEVAELEEKI
jgi:RNAse (barnase) inhibitor barstar